MLVPAVIKSIPAGIPQLSDQSPRYSRNIHAHTRGKPADSAGFPPPHPRAHLYCRRRHPAYTATLPRPVYESSFGTSKKVHEASHNPSWQRTDA